MTAALPLDRQPLPQSARAATVRRPRNLGLFAAVLTVTAIVLLPIASLAVIAASGDGSAWPHLIRNVIPGATVTTVALIAMVAAGTAIIGVAGAWSVVAFDFPGRRVLSWLFVLPLAVPPYLAAYALGEFFHFTGPVQTAIRALFGFATARDYWFPDIRSTPGAAFVLASVLYPYVYLTSRVVFLMQGRAIADVARTLGATPAKVFARVLLPVARPAIIAGVALVLMETVNDIGASEYLGVRTLTFSIYATWLNRGSLEGGAQIALLMLVIVAMLIGLEQHGRRKGRVNVTRGTQMAVHPPRTRLRGLSRYAVPLALCLPIASGFVIPLFVFGRYAMRRLDQIAGSGLPEALATSIVTALATSLLTVVVALFLTEAVRIARSRQLALSVRVASMGYALPGGVLALGLLFVLARFDNMVDTLARSVTGSGTGLLFTGSAAAVILACVIRFLALAEGAIRSGLEKLPPNLTDAARTLGHTRAAGTRLVLLPLLTPAILTAAVLVFVDTIKELSATILLRPFGFNTLATHVYESASRGSVQDGSAAALLIIGTALVPVILLSRSLARDRHADLG